MTISGPQATAGGHWPKIWTDALAEVISTAFSPLAYLTLYLAAVGAVGGAPLLPPLLFLWLGMCLAPATVILCGKLSGAWSDIEVSLLPERRVMLGIVSAIYAFMAWIASARGLPAGLRSVPPALLAATLIAAAITFFWRVSLHATCAGSIAGLCLLRFHPAAALVALVLAAAVAWSRVRLGRHDVPQVVAGTALGLLAALALAVF